MANYAQHVTSRITPQSQPIPNTAQVANSAGGFSWEVDKWAKLHRFLVLGCEGGAYYATEQAMAVKNCDALLACAKENPQRAVDMIVDVSHNGRAPKNDPAIFALAVLAGQTNQSVSRLALAAVPTVCRIGTHILMFVDFVKEFRGWGRGLRDAVAGWFINQSADDLAYQVAKYRQRGGWSMRDLLRKCHAPAVADPRMNAVLRWAAKQPQGIRVVERRSGTTTVYEDAGPLPDVLVAFEEAQTCSVHRLVELIERYHLSREMLPTERLNESAVWEALLQQMPPTALLRNLGKMSAIGLLKPLSAASKLVCEKISSVEALKRARVHPVAVLMALSTYQAGHGVKGNLSWLPVPQVVEALDDAFYAAFDAAEPTGKRWVVGLDVSGSMCAPIMNTHLTARDAGACMAMTLLRTEPQCFVHGFTYGNVDRVWDWHTRQHTQDCGGFVSLGFTKQTRLDAAVQATSRLQFGATDCALPMIWARVNHIEADAFVVITDNESWAGPIHAAQALKMYRKEMGINAKLICLAMVANAYSIADPDDAGMLDCVGFDTSVPAVMADFVRD